MGHRGDAPTSDLDIRCAQLDPDPSTAECRGHLADRARAEERIEDDED
jgi:hypothetical protein